MPTGPKERFCQMLSRLHQGKGSTVESLESRFCFAATDVTGLTLYNADTNQPIGPFENNTTIDYAVLPTNLSVRASTEGAAGSVRFGVDGNPSFHTENYAPYFILGETLSGRPNAWKPTNGTHTMSVTGFSGANGSGTPGLPRSLTFHVANGTTSAPVDPGAVVSFSDNSADAKEAGLDKGTFVISRTGSTASALTVSYNVGGNATNGVDYNTLSGAITIPAGRSSVSLVITPKDDSAVEGTENIVLTINAGSGYAVGSPATATCPIADNDTGSSPSLGTLSFSSIANNPLARAEALGGAVNGKLYVLGGLHTVNGRIVAIKRCDFYNPATNSWTRLRDMPFTPITHAGTAIDGRYLWFVGNYLGDHPGPGNKAVYRYDTANDSWSRGPDLPSDRGAGAAALVGRELPGGSGKRPFLIRETT
jgi:hypothetical protein